MTLFTTGLFNDNSKCEPNALASGRGHREGAAYCPPEASAFGSHGRPAWSRALRAGGAAIVVLACSAASGELTTVEEQTDDGHVTVYRMTVTPAPEPDPALQYRLMLRETEYRPGNAATHYLRSFAENGLSGRWKGIEEKYGFEVVHDWYGVVPLDELPMDDVRNAASQFDSLVEGFIVPASQRRDCDWGHNIDELRGPEIFAVLLPAIQESRSLSRMLSLRTRVDIADGQYDKALDQLRMNYRLAYNTSQAPFLVSSLVGIAQAGVANGNVVELIAAPDSPNLYWALAELPRPLVSIRKALRWEFAQLPRVFPVLEEAVGAEHSPQEWARLLADGWFQLEEIAGSGVRVPKPARPAAMAGMALVIYPAAKARLVASGIDADRVEQMSVGQAIALDARREYQRIADEMEKWYYVPYVEARQRERPDLFEQYGVASLKRGMGYMICALLLPAVEAARNAELRLARHISALQAIEAIRMHAAQEGELPESLDAITCVPVPENPSTSEPFAYRLNGDTALLDLPFSDGHPGAAWRFEIKLNE